MEPSFVPGRYRVQLRAAASSMRTVLHGAGVASCSFDVGRAVDDPPSWPE
jgi:hypothetical protein